jgi:hypothetical protein
MKPTAPSHQAMQRTAGGVMTNSQHVYDATGNVIETHEETGHFKEP